MFNGKHRSIYSRLIDLGYTHDDIMGANSPGRAGNRSAHLSVIEPDGQDPIVGVRYTGDYRAEEEYGMGEIADGLADNQDSVLIDETHLGLLFTIINRSVKGHYGVSKGGYYENEDLARERVNALEHAAWVLNYGLSAEGEGRYQVKYEGTRLNKPLDQFTVPELKAAARHEGIEGKLPTRKADLFSLVRKNRSENDKNLVVPANFHSGRVLGIVAPPGIVADTLRMLHEAAGAKSLMAGGISNPFGRGLVFFDARDRGKALIKAIDAAEKLHRKRMKDVEPAEKALNAAPGALLFVGNPKERDGQVTYWLNYAPRNSKQIFGYFTIEQLLHIAAGDLSEAYRD